MNADEHALTEADRQYVGSCLGRTPQGLITAAARGPLGQPTVIGNHPLVTLGQRFTPQPTLYWLIDPTLSKRISEIERKGGVREIESELKADEALMRSHLQDSAVYAHSRWAMLSGEERRVAEAHGLADVLKLTGIGGVANHAGIKCLHAQYAYHLAKSALGNVGTTVGRLMLERYDIAFKPA